MQQCLDSLLRAGWEEEIRLLVEPGGTLPKRFSHLPVTCLDAELGWRARDLLIVAELLMRAPQADAYVLIRGDVALRDPRHLRRDIEATFWPGSALGPVLLEAATAATEPGWQTIAGGGGRPPKALVIPREIATQFVVDPQVVEDASGGRCSSPALGVSFLDWAFGSGIPVHSPTVDLAGWANETSAETRRPRAADLDTQPKADTDARIRIAGTSVSIVVPTWNCGPYLRPCLNSLLSQTVDAEVIVVDDGSADETSEILGEYAGRIQVARHGRQQGANAARNTGLTRAAGDFVALADADNEYSPWWLEKLLDAALSRPTVGVAYCGYTKVFEDGSRVQFASAAWDVEELWHGNYIDMPSVTRREALPDDGLPEGFRPFDDWRVWLQMASRGWIGKWVPEALYVKRVRREGKTRQSMSLPSRRAREVARLRREYAGLVGLDTPIAVVVPAYGCEDLTVACLAHLADFSGVPFVVYYVDNGSPISALETVAEAAEKLGVRLQMVRNSTNLGFTRAVNQGIEASGSADVLVLNNDCFIGPNCLESLAIELAQGERVAAVGPLTGDGGRQSLRREDCRLWAGVGPEVLGELSDPVQAASRLKSRGETVEKEALAFFCALLSREALGRCGGLDERFPSGLAADDEWCLRVRERGWRTLLALGAYAAHLHGSSFDRLKIDRSALQQESKRLLEEILASNHQSLHRQEKERRASAPRE